MISKRLAAVIVFFALIFAYAVPQAFSAPYWLYDGNAFAQVIWADGTPSSPDQQFYGPAAGSVAAAVSFADGHAQSGGFAASVSSFAEGTVGHHSTLSSGRAAATIYGLANSSYIINFDYTANPKTEGLISSIAHAGYEIAGAHQDLEGSGHFSTIVNGNDWISFYASCQTNAISGSIETSASISNITVDPYNSSAAPIPGAIFLLGPGLVGLAAIKRRFKK